MLRPDAHMDARMDGKRENSIPTTNKVCGGITKSHQFLLVEIQQLSMCVNL